VKAPAATILIVDDKPSFRFLLETYLRDAGYAVHSAANGGEALAMLERTGIDLVLSDLVMPEMDGVTLLREVHRRVPRLPFLVLTAHGSVETAVAAMKEGADDYLLKPIHRDELLLTIGRHLESLRLRQRCDQMESLFNEQFSFQNIKSVTPAMGAVLNAAHQVASFPRTTVAIYGESGTGKEVLARAIHIASGCAAAAFIPVNCAAIPEPFLESELFGHVKGAFTGADSPREGKCRRALGGTLFLDEIGDMPLALQAKLLRVLEEKVFESVGSDLPQAADFRIIVATHRDLKELSRQGRFRTDLFYRLNVFPLTLPPLRQRRADIPGLVDHFLDAFRHDQGKTPAGLSNAAIDLLMRHDWPGNVRELRNCLEYATIVNNGGPIQPEQLRLQQQAAPPAGAASDTITLHFEFTADEFSHEAVVHRLLEWALQRTGNNKSAAARLLRTTRKLFY